jgi:hypothetical protein
VLWQSGKSHRFQVYFIKNFKTNWLQSSLGRNILLKHPRHIMSWKCKKYEVRIVICLIKEEIWSLWNICNPCNMAPLLAFCESHISYFCLCCVYFELDFCLLWCTLILCLHTFLLLSHVMKTGNDISVKCTVSMDNFFGKFWCQNTTLRIILNDLTKQSVSQYKTPFKIKPLWLSFMWQMQIM